MPWSPRAALALAAILNAVPDSARADAGEETAGAALRPQAILEQRCSGCHTALPDGGWSRIAAMRKTPEGWDVSIQRMEIWHGVQISPDERAALVKHLADTRGLAPAEAAPYRYALERRPAVLEARDDPQLVAACARCHTMARSGLQRRDREEWELLSHTHAGQWPTLEYQDKSRDRFWWQLASQHLPAELARRFPLETAAWSDWQRQARRSPVGIWRLRGHRPGRGTYAGTLRVRGDGLDRVVTEVEVEYEDGSRVAGDGSAILYTGYEWRGTARWGEDSLREVYALSPDGDSLAGRWFTDESDALGGDLEAIRVETGPPRIVAVLPGALRAGERRTVAIYGVALPEEGPVALGPGIAVLEVLARDAALLRAVVEAAEDLEAGPREVAVGTARLPRALVVYRPEDIAALRVEPPRAIARVGGGPVPPEPAQFDAIAYTAGADGEPGNDDDLRIGPVAARWRLEPASEVAAKKRDPDYVGAIDAAGLFRPAVAGPNPERPQSTNNTGHLRVVAEAGDGETAAKGEAELVVTVQRWIDPAIR